mmetsp:Transcript_2476/g.5152  ORF Transcript_2476/g.5152 Transcript_2476/m.5152 type:complete len:321 (+) Transcript_2476:156-1118(+)
MSSFSSYSLTLHDASISPDPTHTSHCLSSTQISKHTAHSGQLSWSFLPSPLTNFNQQRAYDESLPVLLPLLVRTLLPQNFPSGSTLSLSLLGPGATSLGLSLLSLPTRDDDDFVKLPGDIHLTSIEVSTSPSSLPLLPPTNPLSNMATPTKTKLIIYDETAIPGEVPHPPLPPSLPSSLSSKVPIEIVPPKDPPITYFLSEIGVQDGFKKYSCTFFIPHALISYRECCELTLHPISSGGSYYELKLVNKRPNVEGLVEELGGLCLQEGAAEPKDDNSTHYIETTFLSPKPDFTAGKLLRVLKERIRRGGVPDGVGDCVVC